MANVQTFEEAIAEEIQEVKAEKIPLKNKSKEKEDKSAVDKLSFDVNNKLSYYLKKMPQWQIINNQIELLKTELLIYKNNNSIENYEKTKLMINELVLAKNELKKIFKNGQSSAEKSIEQKEILNNKIKNSEIIQNLINQKKLLQIELDKNSVSKWIKNLKEYRLRLKMLIDNKNDVVEDFDDVIDNETLMNPNITILEQEYYDFCGKIADILNWHLNDILDSNLNVIKDALSEVLNTEEIKQKLDIINTKISHEKDLLSDSIKVTDLLYDVFDFNDPNQEKEPKEILALTNINYVKSIAYNTCKKYNSLSKIDDAISAGLLGLSVAINTWYTKQSLLDNPLSFKGFSSIYISGAIQRELLGLESGGTESGSTKATINTHNKEKISNFIKDNPQYEEVDKSILIELLANYDETDENGNKINTGVKNISYVTTESDYSNTVTNGEEGDNADVWANASASEDNVEELLEGKMEYEKMLKSISDLLNLFESKKDPKTGLLAITNKKLFDKYDKKIFLMYFGLQHRIEKKIDANGNIDTKNDFTQEEIAEELFYMMKDDGLTINEPFSQPAINYRIQKILTKIKSAMEFNPNLKIGFEYFINIKKNNTSDESNTDGNWRLNNPDLLKKLSNSREEIGMKIDRNDLREIYGNDEDALNRQLSDGKKLSDSFEISDTNPLDDEIANMFNDL